MNEREWALVLAYMRGETKPLLDYIYEELGSADLKYSADRALSIVGEVHCDARPTNNRVSKRHVVLEQRPQLSAGVS